MTEEERIYKGELFASEVPELVAKKLKAHRLSQEYSDLFEEDTAERERILHDLLAIVGEGTFMLGPHPLPLRLSHPGRKPLLHEF